MQMLEEAKNGYRQYLTKQSAIVQDAWRLIVFTADFLEPRIEHIVEVWLLELLRKPPLPPKVEDRVIGFPPYVAPPQKTPDLV